MIPEGTSPEDIDGDKYLKRILDMSRHMDFVGQRADMVSVNDVLEGEEVDEAMTFRSGGILRRVDYNTMSCNECDNDGYYDQRGEVVCEGCGMVLSGSKSVTINTEFNEDGKLGGSRGLEKMSNKTVGHEPSI